MKRNWKKILTAIIAILIALIMILSVLSPLLTSAAELGAEENTEETATDAAAIPADEGGEDVGAQYEESPLLSPDFILNNVMIGPVAVSGMNRETALAAVTEKIAEAETSVVTVSVDEASWTAPLATLGLSFDAETAVDAALALGHRGNILARYKEQKTVSQEGGRIPLSAQLQADAVRSFLGEAAAQINIPVVNRSIMLDGDGRPYVTEGSDGMAVDTDAAFEALMVLVTDHWTEGDLSLGMETHVVPRGGDAEQLARVKDLLGRATTSFAGSSESRCANIANSVRLVNGTVVYPGESFSMLSKAVPFSPENGYALAYSMYDGSLVDTYGGGICQVSTTLYQALLQAELQIDERYEHSMVVGYVKPSFDAAISEEGGKDLVFTNNTDAPLVISGYVDGTDVTFAVYGEETRPENRSIRYENEILSETNPDILFSFDSSLPAGFFAATGSPHVGTEAKLWKEVTVDGQTEKSWVNSSKYARSDDTYLIGTQGMDDETYARLEEATSGKNADYMRQIIAESPYELRSLSYDDWQDYKAEREAEE